MPPWWHHLRDNSRMKRNTKAVGDLSEIMVIAELTRAGYSVAVPLGENNRYDLIAEMEGALFEFR